MTPVLDRGTLDRLIALGRDRGELNADDLRSALPIDSMDVDTLVLVMLELDAAGVSVEPEAFGPRHDRLVPSTLQLSAPTPDPLRPTRKGEEGSSPIVAAQSPATAVRTPVTPVDPGDGISVDRAVLLAGLAVFAALGGILLLV